MDPLTIFTLGLFTLAAALYWMGDVWTADSEDADLGLDD